jgi:four helix bundle protein
MATIERFEDLEAWKLSREVVNDVYRLSRIDDFAKDFGLRDQIRRSAVSIMSNIAEGFERDGKKEFVNFLSIAKGSAGEVRAQLYIARDQTYISAGEFDALCGKLLQLGRLISGLMRYLNASTMEGQKFRRS